MQLEMTVTEDVDIINLITHGTDREKGYRDLIGKYKERLYWHIRRLVDNHDDADDILQNTFIKVLKNIEGFRKESSLYTWLYRIATNESLDFLKKSKNIKSEPFENQDYGLTTENAEDGETITRKLNEAVNQLADKQKAVFNMRYYDEMPYAEIAEITGTSVGALKASYHHAVKKIENYLKENYEF